VQAARKLQRRKGRSATGTFLVEGLTLLQDAIGAGAEVVEVFLEESADGAAAEELCRVHGLRCSRVDRVVGRALAQTVSAPGVVSVVRSPGVALSDIPDGADLILVLAEVQDPGNAGTLIRSAAAAGADAVIFSNRAVDPLGGKTVRSAAGAIFRIALVLDVPLEPAIAALRKRGLSIVAANARAQLVPERCDMTRALALVVGNEAQGIPDPIESLADETVGIPMPGATESLNVGVAGSILLFEAARQRRDHQGIGKSRS
jgi:RNA methyltransferase, TrmH family